MSVGQDVLKKLGTWSLVAGFIVWLLLAVGIYLYGLYLAGESGTIALLLIAFVPLVGQAFLIWLVWSATGVFFNYYVIALLSWIALGVLLGNVVQRR
jgi:hypothetical protein